MEEAYGAPFPIISRSAAALLLNFDRAFGKVPDLHCFNRCTVAARTLALRLGAATRLEMLQLLCRIAYSSGHAMPLGQQE